MITVSAKTKAPNSLKLMNAINTFLFEEQYRELSGIPASKTESLKRAASALAYIVKHKK